MDPMLNHSDSQFNNLFSTNNVGFRLENAGLVNASPMLPSIFFFIIHHAHVCSNIFFLPHQGTHTMSI